MDNALPARIRARNVAVSRLARLFHGRLARLEDVVAGQPSRTMAASYRRSAASASIIGKRRPRLSRTAIIVTKFRD
jgi:hypothetical protein